VRLNLFEKAPVRKILGTTCGQSLHRRIPPLFSFAYKKMFCCSDIAKVTIPVPSPRALQRNPTVIFTEEREDPIAPEKKPEVREVPKPKIDTVDTIDKIDTIDKVDKIDTTRTIDIDEEIQREEKKEDIKDIATVMETVMDPTSVKDIKIRILRMPALPRSPRRLCMRLQKVHSADHSSVHSS